MTYLISILSQFETRYKMVLILTLGLILFVLATAGKLHAEDHSKAQMQYMTGLKLMKDQSKMLQPTTPRPISGLPWPPMRGMAARCFILAFPMKMAVAFKRI
jgi:hypothetical protein